MANWANVNYVIVGNQAWTIANVIDDYLNKGKEPYEGRHESWEGNVIMALGGKPTGNMRGYISEFDISGNELTIRADEAWYLTDFMASLREIYPDIEIYYQIEEDGCGIYETNDSDGWYFPERYFIDCCINGNLFHDYFTKYDAIWQTLSKYGINNIEDVNKFNKTADPDDFIYIHEFEIV
jgi:hypothetical protein